MANTEKDDPIRGDAGHKTVQVLNLGVRPYIPTRGITAIEALKDIDDALRLVPKKTLFEDNEKSCGSRDLPVPPELIAVGEPSSSVDSLSAEDMLDFTCTLEQEIPFDERPRATQGSRCQLCKLLGTSDHIPSPEGRCIPAGPRVRIVASSEKFAEAFLNATNNSTGARGFSTETVMGENRKKRSDGNEYEQGGSVKKYTSAQNGGK